MDARSSRDTADPRRLMLRRGGFAGLTLALAYGGGLWLHLMHEASGAVEPGAPPALIHWLRDSTLLVPFIAIALFGALFLARRLIRPRSSDPVRVTDVAAVVAITAFATSFIEGLLTPLYGIAFGGHEGHGAELPIVEHMLRDGMSALPANLAVAAAVVLALGGRMWLTRDGSPFRLTLASTVRRGAVLFASASLAATSIMAPIALAVALAAPADAPCPTSTIDKK